MTAHSTTAASASLRKTDRTLGQNVINELQGVGSRHWALHCNNPTQPSSTAGNIYDEETKHSSVEQLLCTLL